MLTPSPTERGSDPATATTSTSRVDVTLQLSARALAWLAHHPQARKLISSVWDTLAELEHAGHHPRLIAALRQVLTHHQPTSAGRCDTCRRLSWRRLWRHRDFPCLVWHQIRSELTGVPPGRGHHHQSTTVAGPRTAFPPASPKTDDLVGYPRPT
ncbi:MAG: hypothetical protein ACRDTH_17385 [Pseudonocardiaceae bacterium]